MQSIRDIIILGHRQAFAWIDEWYSMSLTDVRIYECERQRETNTKVTHADGEEIDPVVRDVTECSLMNSSSSSKTSSPSSPKSPGVGKAKSWFSWE